MTISTKWTRATQKRTRRNTPPRGLTMQIHREIAEGYQYFLAKKTKAAAMRAAMKLKRSD
jgi:hypothetical protein